MGMIESIFWGFMRFQDLHLEELYSQEFYDVEECIFSWINVSVIKQEWYENPKRALHSAFNQSKPFTALRGLNKNI